jgi:hypothetical protein
MGLARAAFRAAGPLGPGLAIGPGLAKRGFAGIFAIGRLAGGFAIGGFATKRRFAGMVSWTAR